MSRIAHATFYVLWVSRCCIYPLDSTLRYVAYHTLFFGRFVHRITSPSSLRGMAVYVSIHSTITIRFCIIPDFLVFACGIYHSQISAGRRQYCLYPYNIDLRVCGCWFLLLSCLVVACERPIQYSKQITGFFMD